MIFKVLYLFIIASHLKNVDALMCFNCGYLELVNGTKVPLTEEYGELPFCNDFASGNDNTVMAGIVRIYICIVHYTYIICRVIYFVRLNLHNVNFRVAAAPSLN